MLNDSIMVRFRSPVYLYKYLHIRPTIVSGRQFRVSHSYFLERWLHFKLALSVGSLVYTSIMTLDHPKDHVDFRSSRVS